MMFRTPEKSAAGGAWSTYRWNPMVHFRFKVTTLALFFVGVFIVWSLNGFDIRGFHKDFFAVKLPRQQKNLSSRDLTFQLNISLNDQSHQNQTLARENLGSVVTQPCTNSTIAQINSSNFSSQLALNYSDGDSNSVKKKKTTSIPVALGWISSYEFEPEYSEHLLSNWLKPGGKPCKDSRTEDITIPGLDGHDQVDLPTGKIHEYVFQAMDDSGKPHCRGGDYFETDLSGDSWKSRPPVKDWGNGTYTISLQVHPKFPGNYNLAIILLFRHYEGLKFSPERFAFDKYLRNFTIKFHKSSVKLPEIQSCRKSDFSRDVWSGRWTRHAKNDSCSISDDGRYRCQEPDFPCKHPWCNGPLGLLESNGWIYSTHCSFKLFSSQEAWKCLSDRWIFWWGDSNHCDTVRNILNFMMNVTDIKTVPRLFDMNITNPINESQSVRFTSIFNGHYNASGNYQGLNSLKDEGYRDLLKGYFSQDVVPDTVIMNSGLHDGVFWTNVRNFIHGADFAAKFWAEVFDGVRRRGKGVPEVIYRTTVATGGYARRLAFNPNKMEAFNGVVLDKMRRYGVVEKVIDDFDLTYPWHFDNRCNDGVHYGRAPLKRRWRDGEVGHQYFVDLMLGHVLLNALCAR